MHVTKFYFIQLVLKIKYVEFQDNPKNENVKNFSARRLIKELPTKKMENMNIERFSAKIVNNRFDRTLCDDWLQNVPFIRGFSFTR